MLEQTAGSRALSSETASQLHDESSGQQGTAFTLSQQADGLFAIEWQGQCLPAQCVGRSTLLAQLLQETDVSCTASRLPVPFSEDAITQWVQFNTDMAPEELCNTLQVPNSLF